MRMAFCLVVRQIFKMRIFELMPEERLSYQINR